MAEQAITQEQLFLPLLHFIADHGGEIDRQADNLLDALPDPHGGRRFLGRIYRRRNSVST